MTDSPTTKPGFYGWINATLLFVTYMAAFGFVYYAFSVIFPMMIKTLEWNRGTASLAHTLNAILMGFSAPLVAFSIDKLGTKKTMRNGFILLLFALLLMGTVMNQMWQWIILWGIVISFGFGFGGPLPMQTVLLYWFNVKRATAIGIVMTSAAIGGFVAQPFYSWLMGVTNSWRSGWLFSSVFALVALVCTFFIINKPEDVGQYTDGLTPEEVELAAQRDQGKKKIYKTTEIWNVKEALRTRTIWFFVFIFTAHIMALTFIASHGILNFLDRGFSEMQAPMIFSMVLLGSALIRFPMGVLGDKIEPRLIIIISFIIQLVMLFFIWKNQSITMIMVAGFLFGSSYGSQLILFPTLMGNYYGPEAFSGILGTLSPVFVLFGAVVPAGGGYIFEATGSYDIAYLFLICLLSAAFVGAFFVTPPAKRTLSADTH